MPVVGIFNNKGERIGDMELNKEVFGADINEGLLHEAVRMYLANQRQGTASTKTRSEVRGGGRKPWRQKGTGRARHGSIRSPLWVGGGVTFGPEPRDYGYNMPKKQKKAALRSALSARAGGENLTVLDSLTFDEPKTRRLNELIEQLNMAGTSTLIVTDNIDENVAKSARNLPKVTYIPVNSLNAYHVIRHDNLIITKDALEKIGEVCS